MKNNNYWIDRLEKEEDRIYNLTGRRIKEQIKYYKKAKKVLKCQLINWQKGYLTTKVSLV